MIPANIPESTAWWSKQRKDLFALTDEAELGMMQAMVTISHNDYCPEMLAAIRRGPMAAPTDEEQVEHLLTRVRRDRQRPRFENFAMEHVLSFQRRIHATKEHFFVRGKRTPLGIVEDWWDRTEAQKRAALHAHILAWFRLRELFPGYKPLKPIPKTAVGAEQKQRPKSQSVARLADEDYQEDAVYHHAYVARVSGEMPRPCVAGEAWGGYDVEKLRVAGLARAVLMRLPYLHSCTPGYCLKDRSTCRFFFPWPEQPYQIFDENTERVALRRRLPQDDEWVVPHNLYLAMFSPSSVNVLCFDPRCGADQARGYAGKYCSKPEAWYYLETEMNGLKDWIKCRTVGLCMAFNRLMNFRIVRSTRAVQWTPCTFVPGGDSRAPRDPSHLQKYPEYPDPKYYLNHTQKYFLRSPELRHLRVEQFNRYFALAGDCAQGPTATLEDTMEDGEAGYEPNVSHRHYDPAVEAFAPGTRRSSACRHVPGARRRMNSCLGVSRTPFLEPIGAARELFYEAKLLLGLAWYCEEGPQVRGDGELVWRFIWDPPPEDDVGARLARIEIRSSDEESWEERCAAIEETFCSGELGAVCSCCALETERRCKACRYAVGWHRCMSHTSRARLVWCKGTLHDGHLDAQRVLFNLHRRLIPLEVLRQKADAYVVGQLLTPAEADAVLRAIEQERNVARVANDVPGAAGASGTTSSTGGSSSAGGRLTEEQLRALLAEREQKMREGGPGGALTDQWRVYQHIVGSIERGEYLRLMVQASAGTGKSFLLSTVFLWCLVHGIKAKAAAPTGIAAANIEVKGTDV